MSAVVIPFPSARLIAKVRRVADVIERSKPSIQAAYRGRVLADLKRQMACQGVNVSALARQASAFDRALDAELYRRSHSQHQTPGGSAA